jgi:hypothetical protein
MTVLGRLAGFALADNVGVRLADTDNLLIPRRILLINKTALISLTFSLLNTSS